MSSSSGAFPAPVRGRVPDRSGLHGPAALATAFESVPRRASGVRFRDDQLSDASAGTGRELLRTNRLIQTDQAMRRQIRQQPLKSGAAHQDVVCGEYKADLVITTFGVK